jgi:hypothetical protein
MTMLLVACVKTAPLISFCGSVLLPEFDRLRDPLRRLDETFPMRVLADFDQQLADQGLDLLGVEFHGTIPVDE